MRVPVLVRLFGLLLVAAVATPAGAQERARIAVTVVTLDQLRQVQAGYALAALEALGDVRGGRFDWAPPALAPELFGPCVDRRMDLGLDYCVRFYLTRAELPADAPPPVVVAFDDQPAPGPDRHGRETLRVSCFGRGVVPADAAAQDAWMWPGAERMHGMRDLERDRDALAACISAAASESWTGLRQPDPPR